MVRIFLLVYLIFGVSNLSVPSKKQLEKRPNFILILTDDLGWSCFSSKMDNRVNDSKSDYYETPNIDLFIEKSMRFSKGYAPDPICSPTRRSIQFGRTSIKMGDDDDFPQKYTTALQTIPQVLKSIDNRYKAAHFGKWDLRAKITPEQLGYDASDGDTGNGNGNIVQGKEEKWEKHYFSENPKQMDSLNARAIKFMKDQVNAKNPFYLQVSHYATHVDFVTRQNSYDKFKAKPVGKKHDNPAWAGMIYDLDTKIGELERMVEKLGIADNTYIVLMADNGAVEFIPPVSNKLDLPSSFGKQMRNFPLRGGKWTLYEGGIRVPFIVKGPGIQKNTLSDVPVAGWDLLPTFSELAGGKKSIENLDGGSFANVLKNKGQGVVERANKAFFFHRFAKAYPHSAVIMGDYKLIKFWKTHKVELYNISKDLGELNDISNVEKTKVKELESTLMSYIAKHNPDLIGQFSK
jgi:arylsulfatase A-like enzyme